MRDQDADCVAKPCCTSRCCNSMGSRAFCDTRTGGDAHWVCTGLYPRDERTKPGEAPQDAPHDVLGRRDAVGGTPHCVRSRLRRMQAPQRSSETPRLACKIAPICLIPLIAETLVAHQRFRAGPARRPEQDVGDLPLQLLVGRDANDVVHSAILQRLVDLPLKGEQLHALARCVHYGRLGRLHQRDFERQPGARELPASHPRSYHLLADSLGDELAGILVHLGNSSPSSYRSIPAPIQQAPTRNLLAYKFARFWALPYV